MRVMAIIRRWNPLPWEPTQAQQETALRLSDSYVGGLVRSFADGTAELRTIERGEFRRYIIRQDGVTRVVESRSSTRRYVWGKRLLVLGPPLCITMVVWIVVAQVAGFRDESELTWAAVLVGLALFACFVGEVIVKSEPEPRGEQWTRIGGSEF